MLTLPIKKKWFDMIRSGEKREEYREIKPYYDSRFNNEMEKRKKDKFANYRVFDVMFRNGYSSKSPSFIAVCKLRKGIGQEKWGAKKNKEYYILEILSLKK